MPELALALVAIFSLYVWSLIADAPLEKGDRSQRQKGENRPEMPNSIL